MHWISCSHSTVTSYSYHSSDCWASQGLRKNISRPCSPTLEQVDWLSWTETCPLFHPVPPNLKTPLFQFHPVPPNMETPLSLFHLFHVLPSVPICSGWLYHLSFPNPHFSDFFPGFSFSFHISEKHFWLAENTFELHSAPRAVCPQCNDGPSGDRAWWCLDGWGTVRPRRKKGHRLLSPPHFFLEFTYAFQLSVSIRKGASESPFCVLTRIHEFLYTSHLFHFIYFLQHIFNI